MLMVMESETCFPSYMCCFLSDRKSVIHLQVETSTLSWDNGVEGVEGVEEEMEGHVCRQTSGSPGVGQFL